MLIHRSARERTTVLWAADVNGARVAGAVYARLAAGARSSIGQSMGFLIPGLQVRSLPRLPETARSFATLRVSAAGSRCAHARKAPQVRSLPRLPETARVGEQSPHAPLCISAGPLDAAEAPQLRYAQGFGSGLPLRSRPQSASSSIP